MHTHNKSLSSPIRAQWRLFEKWLLVSKVASDSRRDDLFNALQLDMLKSKKDTPPHNHDLLILEYDAKKANIQRFLDDESTHLAQVEWQRRLAAAGLHPEHWTDISPSERAAVERALGGNTNTDSSLIPPSPRSLPFPSNGRPSALLPQSHHPSSSFQFVDPAAFREEEDQDAGRVHDDHHPHIRLDEYHSPTFSDLAGFTPSVSPERSASSSTSSSPFFDAKHRIGNRYIGPVLHDDQDSKLEEADFEKFKIEIREKKIWEFHYEAAQSGAKLARQLCDRSLDKQIIKDILADHEHNMQSLRRTKEDERKAIVEGERAKRQSEIRRRNALHDSTANPWKAFEAKIHIAPDHDLEPTPKPATTSPEEIWRPPLSWGRRPKDDIPRPTAESSSTTSLRIEDAREQKKPPQNQTSSNKKASKSDATSRWKLPVSIPGKASDGANQDNREEIWIPGRSESHKDATTEPVLPGSPPSQTPESPSSSKVPAGRNVAQTRQAKTTKGKSAWRTQQAPAVVEEPGPPAAEPLSLSTKALGKQKQTKAPGSKPDVASTGLETAHDILSRPRRVSDPPPASPKIFDASGVKKQNSENAADLSKPPKSILKKADRKEEEAVAAPTPPPTATAIPSKKANNVVETKKRGKAGKKGNNPPPRPSKPQKPVTVEDVSDEEADPVIATVGSVGNNLSSKPDAEQPSTSNNNNIAEPKPSVPTTTFSHIFSYTAEEPTPLVAPELQKPIPTVTLPPVESRPNAIWYPPQDTDTDAEDDDNDNDGAGWSALIRPLEERTNKAKHVRFTPSVLFNGGHSGSPSLSIDDTMLAFGWNNPEAGSSDVISQSSSSSAAAAAAAAAQQQIKGRGRALSEASRGADAADRVRNLPRDLKGKGKEKATYTNVSDPQEDPLAWFANQAIESLKGMSRSKPASAV